MLNEPRETGRPRVHQLRQLQSQTNISMCLLVRVATARRFPRSWFPWLSPTRLHCKMIPVQLFFFRLGQRCHRCLLVALQDHISVFEALQVFQRHGGCQRVSSSLFRLWVCPHCTSSVCHTPQLRASQCHVLRHCFLVLEPHRTRSHCLTTGMWSKIESVMRSCAALTVHLLAHMLNTHLCMADGDTSCGPNSASALFFPKKQLLNKPA